MSSASARLENGQFYGRVAQCRAASGFVISEVVHRASRALPRHVHERTYLNLILIGRYDEEVGRRAYAHGPMSLTLRPAGVEHRDRVGTGGVRFFIIEAAPRWLEEASGDADRLGHPESLAGPDALWPMLRLYREFRRWDACSPAVAEELIAAVVACGCGSPDRERRQPPPWLARVHELVRDRYRGEIALVELAREAGVHPAYLSRTFRRHHGRTPGELARALRVRWVCERIADPRRSLADLAFEAGFADQAHMTRILKRHVGTSPGRLRSLLGGG